MPSGIDAALKGLSGGKMEVPEFKKVSYDGFKAEKDKKPVVTEATIDAAEEGLEACQQRIKEQEFKMKKIQNTIAGIAPTKKNKPDIAKHKENLQTLQYDGNYRAALDFVRKHEEREREKRREAAELEDEKNVMAGGLKSKKDLKKEDAGAAAAEKGAKKKDADSSVPVTVEFGPFETDTEVAAVVQSAVEGSAEAQANLEAGLGKTTYKSTVKAEAASMVAACNEKITPKLKRAGTREHALRTLRALLWNPAAVLPSLPAVLTMLEETKLKSEPGGKATDLCILMSSAGVSGKAMPQYVLPVLLDHMGVAAAGKWQVKVGTMGVLKEIMKRMNTPGMCPKQLGLSMPKVMAAVRSALGDARKEVKKEAENVLRQMAKELALTPEVQAMQEDLIASIIDSANMEKATETMHRLANTTFMNSMDSCSFGLLFPIVSRSMRESSHEAKTKGVAIVGASVNLIADPEFLEPYVAELLPLLKECLLHPTDAIQRAAAQSFGSLAVGLPLLCSDDTYPWIMEKLQSQHDDADVSEVDRRGAAHGLAEVLFQRRDLLPNCLYKEILPRITGGRTVETKAGALVVFQFLAHLNPSAFLPHVPRCLQTILDALKEESPVVTTPAVASIKVLIEEYGSTYPRLLLPRLQQALFFETEDARAFAMELFFKFCEKVSDAVKFGQDFLSMEAMPQFYKQSLVCSMFIARTDENYSVRRQANLLWKDKLQSGQKAKAEILPLLQQIIKALKTSGQATMIAAANACLADNKEDMPEDALEQVSALEAPSSGLHAGCLFASPKDTLASASLDLPEEEPLPPPPVQRSNVLASRVEDEVKKVSLPSPLEWYVQAVVSSCCLETRTRADAHKAMEEELLCLADTQRVASEGSAMKALGLESAFDAIFDGVEDEAERALAQGPGSKDVLIRVENIMLMYGGGNLLLKNTTLEMKRGHRYGVVGRNGAGKTTLMSTMGSGGVSQIPKSVKTLHVRPEVLVETSELTAVEFCRRDCPGDTSDDALHAALKKVGYPDDMQVKKVSELSGGWRMKLLLASAMMRECDVLLLDEPTNHLDTGSVAWLVEYLNSLTVGTVMVISHDPNFLNAVCTDIIWYSPQKTLDYYPGNFDDFRKSRQITSDEEAEALLLGNDYDDLKPKEDGDAAAGEDDMDVAAAGVTASLLDKQAKITFPIPGKLQGHSSSKPVMELKNVFFAYNEQEGPMVIKDVSCRLSLNSRVGIIGKNGAGKSTLLNLLCGELWPSPNPETKVEGEVFKNRHLRLAYIAQQHMYHLGEFINSTPSTYIQSRFKNGWDETLQERLIKPESPEEAERIKELAVKLGKKGNAVKEVIGRVVRGNEVLYEVAWENLPDQKQNTMETVAKLKMLGVSTLAKAYDERLAAQQAGIDQRPLSSREIVKHLESFGLEEELVLNRIIGGFSAGQKSKLTLGAAFWTKPHMVAFDEPTNYIDMETLDSLANGLQRFKGGVVVISHSADFIERICDETWLVEGGTITRTKKDEKAKK